MRAIADNPARRVARGAHGTGRSTPRQLEMRAAGETIRGSLSASVLEAPRDVDRPAVVTRPSMKPLSVVHVLGSFGVGGAERVVVDLAGGQLRNGHRAAVVSLSAEEGPLRQMFSERGIDTHLVPKRAHGVDLTLAFRLGALFSGLRPDLIHTHSVLPLVYASLPGRMRGLAVVHTKHGLDRGRPRAKWLGRRAASLTDVFVAVSNATAKQARDNRECAARKLCVVPNGIPLGRFHPDADARAAVRSELGLPPEAAVIGTVGRCHPDKNHGLLVRAASPVLGENVRLVIVGDGPELERLRSEVEASPSSRFVHLLGRRMDVPRVLAALDVFAMSSRTEGLPLVVAEAMAVSLPVVSTAVGGIPEVVADGETGYLVPPGDEEGLRGRLRELVGNTALAVEMGRRGRELSVEKLSDERMLSDYEALYLRALGRS